MQALTNLSKIFRVWNRNLSKFEVFDSKIKSLPKMLGIACQNYRPYSKADEENTKSARRFEEKMAELNDCAIRLATDLNGFEMALTPEEFRATFSTSDPYRITSIPDYNQLGAVSEKENIPVYGLNSHILRSSDYKLDTQYYKQKLDDFRGECDKIIEGMLKLS